MPRRIEVFLAFHAADKKFAEAIISDLQRTQNLSITVYPQAVPPGKDAVEQLLSELSRSKVIIGIIARSLFDDPRHSIVEKYSSGRTIIPILARPCEYRTTCYGSKQPLPLNGDWLMTLKSAQRDLARLKNVVEPLQKQLWSLADEEGERIPLDPSAGATSTPSSAASSGSGRQPDDAAFLQSVLADWSLRDEHLHALAQRNRALDIPDFLSEVAATLLILPQLRCNADDRWVVWQDQVIEYLDRRFPDHQLRERLYAPSKAWHDREQKTFSDSELGDIGEPTLFCPEDPLNAVLELLGTKAGAQWLLLGVVHIGPGLEFPANAPGKRRYTLSKILEQPIYADCMTEQERRRVERFIRAHGAHSPSLMAVLPDDVSFSEMETALAWLHQFRSGQPVTVVSREDLRSAKSAALLNLLGALALWQSRVELAALAYMRAFRRARQEHNPLGGWIAAEGAGVALAWMSQTHADFHPVRKRWEKRLFDAKRQVVAQYIIRRLDAQTDEVRHRYLSILHDKLANDPAELLSHPSFGVFTDELEGIILDQEELGCPPVMTASAINLLGSVRLLDGSPHTAERLPEAVRLLCRYGSSGLTDRAQFFSPALHPFFGGRDAIWRTVLEAGRTPSEWLAKLAFLERHSATLPPQLASSALTFLKTALTTMMECAKVNKGMIRRIQGTFYGSVAEWGALGTQVYRLLFVAAHTPVGVETLSDLLSSDDPRIVAPSLESIHIFPWKEMASLGLMQRRQLEDLADRLNAILDSSSSAPLFQKSQLSHGLPFYRDNRIPTGLAQLLHSMQLMEVSQGKIRKLHSKLCFLLEAGLSRFPQIYRPCLVSEPVWSWLRSRRDEATRKFLRQSVRDLLGRLDKFATSSSYFDVYGYVARILDDLDDSESTRLNVIISKHLNKLQRAASVGDYAVRPLIEFAAQSLLGRGKRRKLPKTIALEWISNAPAQPALLSELTLLPPRVLGSLEPSIGQAVLHALSGVTTAAMPWFHSRTSIESRNALAPEDLIEQGLSAVHVAIHAHPHEEPSCGYRVWLELVLAHCYQRNPKLAGQALSCLGLALRALPQSVDHSRAASALAWGLASTDHAVHDAALYAATEHRLKFAETPAGAQLSSALARWNNPPTLSSAWAKRLGEHQAAKPAPAG